MLVIEGRLCSPSENSKTKPMMAKCKKMLIPSPSFIFVFMQQKAEKV